MYTVKLEAENGFFSNESAKQTIQLIFKYFFILTLYMQHGQHRKFAHTLRNSMSKFSMLSMLHVEGQDKN